MCRVNPSKLARYVREQYEVRGKIGLTSMADATYGISRGRFNTMLNPESFIGSSLMFEEVLAICKSLNISIDTFAKAVTDRDDSDLSWWEA